MVHDERYGFMDLLLELLLELQLVVLLYVFHHVHTGQREAPLM